jgi:hypothetical protein
MIIKGYEIYDTPYNHFIDNCATLRGEILNAGGLYRGSWAIPNLQYEQIKALNGGVIQ